MDDASNLSTQKSLNGILSWTFALVVAIVMIVGAFGHLTMPEYFVKLVPEFLPPNLVLNLTAVVQFGIGFAVLWPPSRRLAGLAFALLCLAYMPLHLWDFFRSDPVFQPPTAATIRVIVQIGFVWLGLTLWSRPREKSYHPLRH